MQRQKDDVNQGSRRQANTIVMMGIKELSQRL